MSACDGNMFLTKCIQQLVKLVKQEELVKQQQQLVTSVEQLVKEEELVKQQQQLVTSVEQLVKEVT